MKLGVGIFLDTGRVPATGDPGLQVATALSSPGPGDFSVERLTQASPATIPRKEMARSDQKI